MAPKKDIRRLTTSPVRVRFAGYPTNLFRPGLEDSLKEEYRGEVSWRCGGSGPVQNWFWWGSVRHDRVTHGRWEESPGNLYLRLLKVSHENVNNTGLQGQPRSAVRSLCLIFAAGISASHEMSQSQSYVFNPLESSHLLLFRRSSDELTLPLFFVIIVSDRRIFLIHFPLQ